MDELFYIWPVTTDQMHLFLTDIIQSVQQANTVYVWRNMTELQQMACSSTMDSTFLYWTAVLYLYFTHMSESHIIIKNNNSIFCQNACTFYQDSIIVVQQWCQCTKDFFSKRLMLRPLASIPSKSQLPWQSLWLQQGHSPSAASPLWTLPLVFIGALGRAVSTTIRDAAQVAAVCFSSAPLRPLIFHKIQWFLHLPMYSLITATALVLKWLDITRSHTECFSYQLLKWLFFPFLYTGELRYTSIFFFTLKVIKFAITRMLKLYDLVLVFLIFCACRCVVVVCFCGILC